jgi:hypothetical protein
MIPNLGAPPRRGNWSTDTPYQPTSFQLWHDGAIVRVHALDSAGRPEAVLNRWFGKGAEALGFTDGQLVERDPYLALVTAYLPLPRLPVRR